MTQRIRPATAADEPFLIEMLYEALFVPPGEPPFPRSVVDRPDLARHVRGFGQSAGDAGWIVETGARPLGAAWVRRLPADDPGYGWIDADTPELSIAVADGHRGKGLGTALMTRLVDAVTRCSLSVDDRNPAVRLYERFGFEVFSKDGHSLVMLRVG